MRAACQPQCLMHVWRHACMQLLSPSSCRCSHGGIALRVPPRARGRQMHSPALGYVRTFPQVDIL